MAGKVISTVNMKETLTAGKDNNLDTGRDKKNDNIKDFPLHIVDQSKTCSTRNIVPNKRQLEKKDVDKFVRKLKDSKKVEMEEKKKGRPRKIEKEINITEE